MSKIKIQGNASGTGVLTVTAPNSNTDRTITLPDGDVTLGAATPSITDNGNSTAITIDSSERVGIGVTPATELHVSGKSSSRNTLVNNVTIDGGTVVANPYEGFGFGINYIGRDYGNAVRNYAYVSTVMESKDSSTGGGDAGFKSALVLGTNSGGASGTDPTEKLRITSDGRGLSQFTAKAWVNFNGTGTVAIRDSHNVSSITDHTTGDYSVNFSNNMANSNYSLTACSGDLGGRYLISHYSQDSTGFRLNALNSSSGGGLDPAYVMTHVFGD